MAKIKGGYYIKARCVQESEIAHAPPHVREMWDWFLMQANHSSEKKYGHILEKGQLLCTYAEIQEALHWMVGWRKQTYSKSDCETSMKWLKKRGNVTTRKTTRGMIVTICNYEYFQNPKNYENHKERRPRTTMEPQCDDTIDKKLRIKEERKEYIPDFDSVWKRYPNNDGKKLAISYFNATVKTEEDFNSLNKALDNYLAHLKLQENSWKSPKNGSTWFNNWHDWINWKEPIEYNPEASQKELERIAYEKRERKAREMKAKIMAERNAI